MQVTTFDDPSAWLAATDPLLAADEPRHNLLYGIAHRLIHQPVLYPEHRLWVAGDPGRPTGAMLQTPPYPVILARPADAAALEALIDAVVPLAGTIPGVNGAVPEVEAFAHGWSRRTDATASRALAMGIYACTVTREVPRSTGAPRRATPDDMDALFPLFLAFADEALHDAVRDREREEQSTLDRLMADPADGGVWIWEDAGAIVSITGHGGRTPHGIRIGPVYTPPGHRRRGYATSLVAAQTSWLLAHAVEVCFLYTDLANATSNAVYRRIGYEQVAEAAEYRFDAQPQSGGSGA